MKNKDETDPVAKYRPEESKWQNEGFNGWPYRGYECDASECSPGICKEHYDTIVQKKAQGEVVDDINYTWSNQDEWDRRHSLLVKFLKERKRTIIGNGHVAAWVRTWRDQGAFL